MKKAPIWELSFLCDAECEQRLGVVPKAGEALRVGKAGLDKAGHRMVASACLESEGRAPGGIRFPCVAGACSSSVLALLLDFLIPGVGLEERFGCWRAVGIGVVAVVIFGFGTTEGVVFGRGLLAGACGFERGVCVCCDTAAD